MRDQISTKLADVNKTVTENYNEANQRVLDAVVENSRKAADFYVKTANQVAEQLPSIDLPFEVPTATDAAERYMDLVERVVEMNRDFSDRIVKLNREYSDRVDAMLTDEAAKPAPKAAPAAKTTTARKSTARKSTARKTARKATKPAAKKATKPAAKKATTSK